MDGWIVFFVITTILLIAWFFVSLKNQKINEEMERKKREDSLNKEFQEYLTELKEIDSEYHSLLNEWRAFYEKYEHLGKPTYYIGYTGYQDKFPWNYPNVSVPYDVIENESDLQLRVNCARNAGIDFRLEYSLPRLNSCATFYKDAQLAIIANREFTPKQLRFIKSNVDKSINKIIVTVTTNNIEEPTFTMLFDREDRSVVDDFKAAFNAFKMLK